MAKSKELVTGRAGDGKAKLSPAKSGDWTTAKEARFLEALTATCNVTLAAKRARVATSTVYVKRSRDAAFRDGWARAIAQGYARRELETLERAINGEMREIVHKDGTSEKCTEYNDRVALTLLRLHRTVAGEPERREEMAVTLGEDGAVELRATLMAKLKRVRVKLVGAARADEDGWDAIGPPALTLDVGGDGDDDGDGDGDGESPR